MIVICIENMSENWKRLENEKGFPFYYNEKTNSKQLDHPKFTEIKQRLDNCNYIKYATYRVASKFRVLQQSLYMDEVPLMTVVGVFEKHKLGPTESGLSLEVYDLEAILSDIYFATNKQCHANIDIDFATDLMINLLYNIYDSNREGNIQVSTAKLLLALLSNCKVSEFYKFLFFQCSDHNYCVTRLRLQSYLSKLADIMCYLHEDFCYGHYLVNISVESCFNNCLGLIGINQPSFISWLESGPQILSWLVTLYRLKISEGVIHNAKCSICKACPVIGLRYKCTKCMNYIQCQRCFFENKTNNSHKTNHPMKEYCIEGKGKEFSHSMFKKMLGVLKCSSNDQTGFNADFADVKLLRNNQNAVPKTENNFTSNCDKIRPLSSPQIQLQLIIKQLELQNRELKDILVGGNHKDKELKKYLEEHRSHIGQQIQKLKTLQEYLQSTHPTLINNTPIQNKICGSQSTPMVTNLRYPSRDNQLRFLSPIAQVSECGTYIKENNRTQSENDELFSAISEENNATVFTNTLDDCSMKDISSWFRDPLVSSNSNTCFPDTSPKETNNDLDDVLVKLQQILANNFILDEDLDKTDNDQLQYAVTEVETMLSSLRNEVESNRL